MWYNIIVQADGRTLKNIGGTAICKTILKDLSEQISVSGECVDVEVEDKENDETTDLQNNKKNKGETTYVRI